MKKQRKPNTKPRATAKRDDFPGYPQYPASEDIMNRNDRVDMDIEDALEGNGTQGAAPAEDKRKVTTESDLTKDDFRALGDDEIESVGDDEILQRRVYPVDFAGQDLDIPGADDDDRQESIGSEDEENNSYSLGGDSKESLEEDPS